MISMPIGRPERSTSTNVPASIWIDLASTRVDPCDGDYKALLRESHTNRKNSPPCRPALDPYCATLTGTIAARSFERPCDIFLSDGPSQHLLPGMQREFDLRHRKTYPIWGGVAG